METTVEAWTECGAASESFEIFFLTRYTNAYAAEADHIAEILSGQAKPLVGITDGVEALRLAGAALNSVSSGTMICP